jgi:hypothetical protein
VNAFAFVAPLAILPLIWDARAKRRAAAGWGMLLVIAPGRVLGLKNPCAEPPV